MRALFIYWKVPPEQLAGALAAAREFQAGLSRRHPSLVASLYQRAESGPALVTLMGRHRLLRLRIELGASAREITTPTLFVGNNRLQLEQVGVAEAPSLDEGCIAAVILRPIGALAMLGLMLRGSLGTLGDADTVESFKFHRMLVKPRRTWGNRTVKVAFDGEVSRMTMPLEFQVSPKPLYLLKLMAQPRVSDSGHGSA